MLCKLKVPLLILFAVIHLLILPYKSGAQPLNSFRISIPGNSLELYGSLKDNNSVILYGIVGTSGNGGKPIVIKMDASNQIVWQKSYQNIENILIRSACLNAEGGITLAGNTIGINDDIVVIKLDESGDLIWSRKYGSLQTERGFKITQIPDGSYVLCGSSRDQNAAGEEDVLIMSIDQSGTMKWQRVFGGSNRDNAFDIIYSSDNKLVFTGPESSAGSGDYDFGIGKLDLDGNLDFYKSIGTSGLDHSRVIKQLTDGGYLIIGHSDYYGSNPWDVILVKTDINGEVVWSKRYYSSEEMFTGDITLLNDGFLISGSTTQSGDRNLFAFKTDQIGNPAWGMLFDSDDAEEFLFGAKGTCYELGSDQYVGIGKTMSGAFSEGLIFNFTSSANTDCFQQNFLPSSQDIALSSILFNPVISPFGFTDDAISISPFNVQLEKDEYCIVVKADFNADTVLCKGDSVQFNNLSYNLPLSYLWTFEGGMPQTSTEKDPLVLFPESGTYTVSLKVENNGFSDEIIKQDYIRVIDQPVITLGPDTSLCDSEEILLTVVATGAIDHYIWNDGSINSTLLTDAPGQYYVTAYTMEGCNSSDTLSIAACCRFTLEIPNAFTPNGDNINETFKPVISATTNYSMIIANRWGAILFETNDTTEAWDGKFKGSMCPEGVYFVILNYDKCDDLGEFKNETSYGAVSLIR